MKNALCAGAGEGFRHTGQRGAPPEKYSIEMTTGNHPFVEVERDILDGIPKEQWVATVKENLKKKFPNGIAVGNNDIRIDKQSRQEMTFSRYMRWLYNKDPQIHTDKLCATSNRRWEKTRHAENKDAPYGMYRYDTTFAFPVQGGESYKAFNAELVIRNASDGKKYLYDIVSIKENTGLALDLNDKARGRRESGATRSDVSMDSIRSPEQKSQEKFSLLESAPEEDTRRSEKINEPTIATRELKNTLLKMFAVPRSEWADVSRVIDYFADRVYRNGELTQVDRDAPKCIE